MFVIFFNIDWKAVFRTNRKCWWQYFLFHTI
jgi:hypothetical protein